MHSAIDELYNYIEELLDVSSITVNDKSIRIHDSEHPLDIPEASEECDFTSETPIRPEIGQRIEVFWPDDNQLYVGAVTSVIVDGMFVVTYDEKDVETLNMAKEKRRF